MGSGCASLNTQMRCWQRASSSAASCFGDSMADRGQSLTRLIALDQLLAELMLIRSL